MLDLIVRGGQVVAPWGVGMWDVAVHGEKIVAIAEPHSLTRLCRCTASLPSKWR